MSSIADKKTNWLIFLIWPFGALIKAAGNTKKLWARNFIWAFCTYFGFTMVSAGEGADNIRIREWLDVMNQQGFSFNTLLGMLYSETNAFVDFVQPLITFIVAQFTNDDRILYAVFGFFFGYFYSGNINYVSSLIVNKKQKWSLYLLGIFIFIVPFWEMNGFRFWTASHIFLYGALPYILERRKNLLGFVVLSMFVHFSFFIPVIIFLTYIFAGNRLNIFFILFIISLTISELDLQNLNTLLSGYVPDFLLPRVNSYLNVNYADRITEARGGTNWYVIWHGRALFYALVMFYIFIYLKFKKSILKSESLLNLFSFCLLFFAFANLTSLVPSGGRFMSISFFFSIIFLLLTIQQTDIYRKLKPMLLISSPAFILYITVKIRIGFDFLGLATILANPLIAPFITNDIPLIELIK